MHPECYYTYPKIFESWKAVVLTQQITYLIVKKMRMKMHKRTYVMKVSSKKHKSKAVELISLCFCLYHSRLSVCYHFVYVLLCASLLISCCILKL